MIEYPIEQIRGTEAQFVEKGFPTEEVKVGESIYKYFVLPQQLAPDIPDFALRMTHTDSQTQNVTGIFGVCESVPLHLRPFWASHEIIEFTVIGISTEKRCSQAERRVLDNIPPDLKREYIERRIPFFERLIDYFKADMQSETPTYTEADIHEAEESLELLRQEFSL